MLPLGSEVYSQRQKSRCNLDVDDLLMLVSDKEAATKLLRDFIKSCAETELRLTRFSSNNKNMIVLVSDEDRRKGLKNQDINGQLRTERGLRVHLVIEEDNLGFSFSLKDKLLTRREMLSTLSLH